VVVTQDQTTEIISSYDGDKVVRPGTTPSNDETGDDVGKGGSGGGGCFIGSMAFDYVRRNK
jgi:hypothetical protein